jgi:hypothetical protein
VEATLPSAFGNVDGEFGRRIMEDRTPSLARSFFQFKAQADDFVSALSSDFWEVAMTA